MVTFSSYPEDPRPRRAVDALVGEGMQVDLVCLGDEKPLQGEKVNGIEVFRVPISHRRGGGLLYLYNYAVFIVISAFILAFRTLKRRYDLVYVHNMPDILVLSSLVPKALGAKVVLDMHDPMPELMTTIFKRDSRSRSVRLLRTLEKWSMARADLVVTVNNACRRLFSSRSCSEAKLGVVMNSPDETIFPFRTPQFTAKASDKPFVMMYHGSLVERNGVDLAIEALSIVRGAVPAATLRIYGRKTAFLDQVMREVRNEGLENSVHYLGPRCLEDLVPEIESCDVGIIPNHRNAFTELNTPTRIFEYLSLGKPVIAPRAAGICDYFDRRSLVFFELGNAMDLARGIEFVHSHPTEVIEIVRRGQEIYREHSWPVERKRLIDLIARVVGGNVTRVGSRPRGDDESVVASEAVGRS